MSTEVASTRLPKEILREIDREASARGLSRSVYLADLIERGPHRESSSNANADIERMRSQLATDLRDIRESYRSVAQAIRGIQAALQTGTSAARVSDSPAASPAILDRLTFSTFFSEALLKRVSALLYRNPGELSQVVREAREQAEAEAKLWRERLQGGESPRESL